MGILTSAGEFFFVHLIICGKLTAMLATQLNETTDMTQAELKLL